MLHYQIQGMTVRFERVMSQAKLLAFKRVCPSRTISAVPGKAEFVPEWIWGKILGPGSDICRTGQSHTSGGRREGETLQVIRAAEERNFEWPERV